MKDVLGACDLVRVGGTPESSVALGSVHETDVEAVPDGTVTLLSLGQFVMTGGIVSDGAAVYQKM